jgi:hypothetical protein
VDEIKEFEVTKVVDPESALKWLCKHRYYLRDDYALSLRDNPGYSLFWIDEEGYSLRVAVFAGKYAWACMAAHQAAEEHRAKV